jgi:hypothetical protein
MDYYEELTEAFAETTMLTLAPGVYPISQPLIVGSGKVLSLEGAVIQALPDFSGSAVIKIIENDGDDAAWFSKIIGGRVDANFATENCIEIVRGRKNTIRDIMCTRPLLHGIIAGTHPTQTSTGINCMNIECWWHEDGNPVEGHHVNDLASVGIYHKNCTDSYISTSYAVGFRRGFVADKGNEFSQCHAWGRLAHGPMEAAFRVNGGGSFSQCYADTPHNWYWNGSAYVQDENIAEVYGFDLQGFAQHLSLCSINNNIIDHPTNNLLVGINIGPQNGGWGYMFGTQFSGGSSSYKYKKHFGGSLDHCVILGIQDDGPGKFVDSSTGKQKIGNKQLSLETLMSCNFK